MMEIETNAWGLPELCTCTDVGHSPHQCSRCGAGVCEGCGKNDLSTCFKWTCKGSCKDFHHIKGGRTTNAAPSLFQILCNMRSQDEHILSPNSAALRVKGDENKTAAAKRSLGSQVRSKWIIFPFHILVKYSNYIYIIHLKLYVIQVDRNYC